jgi:hypothetical protein
VGRWPKLHTLSLRGNHVGSTWFQSKLHVSLFQSPLRRREYLVCGQRFVVYFKGQSRSPSLRSSGRNVRLWDNPFQFQGGIWLAVEMVRSSIFLARIPGFRKRIIPEPHVPLRGSQARGTRLLKGISVHYYQKSSLNRENRWSMIILKMGNFVFNYNKKMTCIIRKRTKMSNKDWILGKKRVLDSV